MPRPSFRDRKAAGQLLAARLVAMKLDAPAVFALPRGGVPVAGPIAAALHAPLDLLLVRKLGVPFHPEIAAASVVDGERPDVVFNESVMKAARLTPADVEAMAQRELPEIERRRALYLPGRAPVAAAGKTAILVDDGIATGASMRAAIAAVRRRNPRSIIVAAPVASPDTIEDLRAFADDVIVLTSPPWFQSVGTFYLDFHQLTDAEVIRMLATREDAAPAT
jgi:putative phosphoribosyl transferase